MTDNASTDQEQTERGASTEPSGTTPFAIVEAYAFNGVHTGEQLVELRKAVAAHRKTVADLRADLERVTAELAETRADVQRGIERQRGYADRLVESQTLLQQVAAERDAMRERVSLLANAAQAFRNGRYEMGEAWLARVESLNATRKATADAAEEGK